MFICKLAVVPQKLRRTKRLVPRPSPRPSYSDFYCSIQRMITSCSKRQTDKNHVQEIIYKTMHGHGERYANYKSSNLWTNQNHQSPGTYPGKIGNSGSGHNITGSHYSTPNQAKGPSLILNEYTKRYLKWTKENNIGDMMWITTHHGFGRS